MGGQLKMTSSLPFQWNHTIWLSDLSFGKPKFMTSSCLSLASSWHLISLVKQDCTGFTLSVDSIKTCICSIYLLACLHFDIKCQTFHGKLDFPFVRWQWRSVTLCFWCNVRHCLFVSNPFELVWLSTLFVSSVHNTDKHDLWHRQTLHHSFMNESLLSYYCAITLRNIQNLTTSYNSQYSSIFSETMIPALQ